MKSMFMKSIYAGLGLLGTGKETVEQLGRKLAKQADISEKDGERIARHLQVQSKHALEYVTKTMETEVNKLVDAFHHATKQMGSASHSQKTTHRKAKPKPKVRRHKPKKQSAT
jgi:hypothetical protein